MGKRLHPSQTPGGWRLSNLLQVAVLTYVMGWSPLAQGMALRRSWLRLPQGALAAGLSWWLFGSSLGAALAGFSILLSCLLSPRHRPAVFTLGAGVALVLSPAAGLLSLCAYTLLSRVAGLRPLIRPTTALIFPLSAYFLGQSDSVLLYGLWWVLAVSMVASPRRHAPGLRRAFHLVMAFSLVVSLGTFYYLNRYVYHGFGMHVDLIRSGAVEFPVVVLTFDDGPDPIYTPIILDILRDKGVTATFFVLGRQVELYPELAQRMVAEGHTLANHTYGHRHLPALSPGAQEWEIKRAEEVIWRVTGVWPKYFRPPRGMYTAHLLGFLEEAGYTMVLWSLSSQDWAELSAASIASNIIRRCQPGDILLFHDGGDLVRSSGGYRRNTVKALPVIIDALRAQGYHFVTLREMLMLKGLTADE